LKDIIGSAFFAGVSVFVYFASESFALEGNNASSLARNPALYPRIFAFIMIVLSLVVLVKAIRNGALGKLKIEIDRKKLRNVAVLVALVFLYVLSINYLGYLASSMVFLFLLILLYGGTVKQGVKNCIPITLGLYLIFQIIFKIPLPVGELFELLK